MNLPEFLQQIQQQLDGCLLCKTGTPRIVMAWLSHKKFEEQPHPRLMMPAEFYGLCVRCMQKHTPETVAELADQLLGDKAGRLITPH